MHYLTAWGRGMELLKCSASLPGGTEQCNSCNTCRTAGGRWAVEVLERTA